MCGGAAVPRPGAILAAFFLAASISAQSLPELFHKAKAQVKGESWSAALQTLDALDAEAARPGNEAARQQLAAPTIFYRAVCESNLGDAEKAKADFSRFLELEPGASMDPSMYSKKAIAAFDAARKSQARPPAGGESDGRPAMFVAFQEFKMPPNAGERVNEKWGDGPVRWIMTSEEKRAWAELSSGGEWQEFVDKFWEARNPRPGNPDNSYKTSFDRRVAFADSRFGQSEGTRGSMTDRGMVFVLLGPPTYVGRKPIRPGDDATDPAGASRGGSYNFGDQGLFVVTGVGARAPNSDASNFREVWHYRRELLPKGVGYQQVDVEFITKKGFGVNVIQRDPATLATLEAAARPKTDVSNP
jgi:GWxTD domain-containing protein